MKIAIIYDTIYPYSKGGGEKRIYLLSKKLAIKHEVHIFCMKYWKGSNLIKKENVYLHGVCKSINIYNKKGRRDFFQPIYFAFNLAKNLMKYDFDVIECQNIPYFHCFIAKIYSLLKKKPLIITWIEIGEGIWPKLGVTGFIGKNIENLAFKLTKNNIALSEQIAKKIKNKSIIIPVGINLKKIKKVKKSKEKFDILFVGRLIPEKNVDLLIQAVKNSNLKVAIIGEGPEKNSLIKLVNKLDISNISFLGPIENEDDVYSYMKSSKILVLPSIREGFGIVILEALACGCKVITTNSENNNAQFLVNKKFICDPNVEGIKEKIYYALGKKYINHVNLSKFDIDDVTKKMEDYYERSIKDS